MGHSVLCEMCCEFNAEKELPTHLMVICCNHYAASQCTAKDAVCCYTCRVVCLHACLCVCWSRTSALQKSQNIWRRRLECGLPGAQGTRCNPDLPVGRATNLLAKGVIILRHAQTCRRLIFSTLFTRDSSDAEFGYQCCGNLFRLPR